MCEGFGLIVSKELNTYFCEPERDSMDCSHSEMLRRLGWKENGGTYLRNFVRVQFKDWKPESFQFDEEATLPGWAEEQRDEITTKCIRILNRCAPAWAELEKVRDAARAEFEKVRDTALAEYEKVRDAALAEYEKVRTQARAEYEKVRTQAWAEYEKVRDAARAEFEKVRDTALAEYEKVCTQAWAEYEKVRTQALAELITTFSKIDGYVPEKLP